MLVRGEMLALIEKILQPAIEAQVATGIPSSVLISQALVESDYGRSRAARELNNFFNIPAGRISEYRESASENRLRRFSSVAQCFVAHARLLESFYPSAVAIVEQNIPARTRTIDEFFLESISFSGYSSRKSYWREVVKQFNRWKPYLVRFDKLKGEKTK